MSSTAIVDAKTNSTAQDPLAGADAGNYNSGDLLIINCSQTDDWEIAVGNEAFQVNANGKSDATFTRGNQNFRNGALVGSFDSGHTFFAVGTRLEMKVLTTSNTSNLRLYCWDSDFANNAGTIKAYITSVPAVAFGG